MNADLSLEAARARDAADPASARRAEFHFPRMADGRDATYLCGNSLGLQPRRAAADVAAFMGEWQRLGSSGAVRNPPMLLGSGNHGGRCIYPEDGIGQLRECPRRVTGAAPDIEYARKTG